MMTKPYGFAMLLALGLGLSHGCGSSSSSSDAPATSDDTDTDDDTDTPVPGTLALAIPNISMDTGVSPKSGTSLRLQDTDDKIEAITTVPSKDDRAKVITEITEAETIADCFKLQYPTFEQPACFSPKVERSTIQANPTNYAVTVPNNPGTILYGDGGIMQAAATGGEACVSATVNHYVGSAIQIVEMGRQAFASLVCASKFVDVDLPEAGATTSYLDALKDVELPDGASFTTADIKHTTEDSLATYRTTIGLKFKDAAGLERIVYAHAVKQDTDGDAGNAEKGHAIVFTNQQADELGKLNGATNYETDLYAAVAATYELDADGDSKIMLDKMTFWHTDDTRHPAKFITAEGAIDYNAIGAISSGNGNGNGVADNLIRAIINQNADGTSQGIVGWSASINDEYWRSFTYSVTASDANESLKATFGFSRSWENNAIKDPAAAKLIFCSWPDKANSQQLVQFQSATRNASSKVFVHNAAESKLKYMVGHGGCGTGADRDLLTVDASGNISPSFTAPTVSKPAAVGGLSFDAATIKLDP
ncbi:hypothetical protein [Oligoflexus tunisiensis]|uniref:hypothetical protein n=1 Tax=Oligoflexus tunisiensis TaxID=708132 RepID=UPI00114D2413|nr:hypothetical protein [Oligoflexus tunisiensis]